MTLRSRSLIRNLGQNAGAQSYHGTNGFAGAGVAPEGRTAAEIWGGLTNSGNAVHPPNASAPTLDRVKADALGCTTASLAAPRLDDGTAGAGHAFPAVHSGTITGASVVVTGGIAANDRPFVVGQALSCSGCTTGRFITAISLPPTQDSRSGAGQVGRTFTVTANGSLLLTGPTLDGDGIAGCISSGAGTANCGDIAFAIHTQVDQVDCSQSRDLRREQSERHHA